MKISCEEAAHICTKAQYKEARFWEILQLRLHLLYCKVCGKFSKRNKTLTDLCHRAKWTLLSQNEKEALKKVLKENH